MLTEEQQKELDVFLNRELEKPPIFGGDKEKNPYEEMQRKDYRFWGLKRKKRW